MSSLAPANISAILRLRRWNLAKDTAKILRGLYHMPESAFMTLPSLVLAVSLLHLSLSIKAIVERLVQTNNVPLDGCIFHDEVPVSNVY